MSLMMVSNASLLANRLDIAALLGSELRIQQQSRHPNHGIQRRPDLMAHSCQEFALAVGCFRGFFSFAVLPCPLALGDICKGAEDADNISFQIMGGTLFVPNQTCWPSARSGVQQYDIRVYPSP